VKIKTLYTHCERAGRRGKDDETKRVEERNKKKRNERIIMTKRHLIWHRQVSFENKMTEAVNTRTM
jgi:hypothetical protein